MLECANNYPSFLFGEQKDNNYPTIWYKGMYAEEEAALQGIPQNSFSKQPSEKIFNETHLSGSPKYSNSTKSSYPNYPGKDQNWNFPLQQNLSLHAQSYQTPVTTCNNWIPRARKSSFSPNPEDETLQDSGPRMNSCKKSVPFSDPGPKMMKQNAQSSVLMENGRSIETPTGTRQISRNTERVGPLPPNISTDVRQSAIGIGSESAAQIPNCQYVRQPSENTTCGSTNPSLPNFGYAATHNFPATSLHLEASSLNQEGLIIGSSK